LAQVNLHKIEQYSTDKTLKYEAASKLLALSQDLSNPQATIDILFSLPVRLNNPDMIEQAIPVLCKAVKDRSSNISDKDVLDKVLSRMIKPSFSYAPRMNDLAADPLRRSAGQKYD
jgi:hypothetical protein